MSKTGLKIFVKKASVSRIICLKGVENSLKSECLTQTYKKTVKLCELKTY